MATILVVEPDVLIRLVICDYLRGCGYRVIEAGTSDEAMTVVGSDIELHVVFAEVHGLGSRDGFTLARAIRESHPKIDVILTSSIANASDKAAELCEDGLMTKPYEHEDIARRIKMLRERRDSLQRP
jgi:CheY-like chemotaxis protein